MCRSDPASNLAIVAADQAIEFGSAEYCGVILADGGVLLTRVRKSERIYLKYRPRVDSWPLSLVGLSSASNFQTRHDRNDDPESWVSGCGDFEVREPFG